MGTNPNKKPTTRAVWVICIVATVIIVFAMRDGCQKKPKPSTHVETIKYLHDTVYRYQPAKYQPAITKIRDRYRVLLDTVERWTFDSTWSDVCRMLPDSQRGERCQREVVRRIISGQRDSELIGIYQSQRTEDSLQIAMMFKLDSLTSEQLKLQKGEIAQEKKQGRKKAVKFGLLGLLVGFVGGAML